MRASEEDALFERYADDDELDTKPEEVEVEVNEDGEEVETDEYEYDVHIVIEHRGKDTVTPDGLIARQYGFSYCGIIYLLSGDERLAYHRAR